MGGDLQFADFLEEDGLPLVPASYVTTGSHHTVEHMVRTHGRSPTSSFPLCSLFCDALCLPQDAYLDFPRTREWKAAAARYRVVFEPYAIQPKDSLIEGSTLHPMYKSLWRASTTNGKNA